MARNEAPPFPRGKTYYEGNIPLTGAGSPDIVSHNELEGKVWIFEDVDYSVQLPGQKPYRTGKYVICMCVRNVSGAAILAKQVVPFKTNGAGVEYAGQVVAPSASALGARVAVADEFLPAAGVANNDLFWVVIGGPTKVTTDTAGTTTINIGDVVIPGATTAGRVIKQDNTVAAGAATFAQINGELGRAITAVAAPSNDFLLDMTQKIPGVV
jgi:hypothetical protein